jgi:hypothetical protein
MTPAEGGGSEPIRAPLEATEVWARPPPDLRPAAQRGLGVHMEEV